jgi:hypothetical protein
MHRMDETDSRPCAETRDGNNEMIGWRFGRDVETKGSANE